MLKELFDNALDAAEESEIPPEIEIIVGKDGTITVTDNANGIATETIKAILDYSVRGRHLADIEAVLEQMGERPHAKAPPPMVRPVDSRRGLLRIPRRSRSCASARTEPSSR